MQYWQREWCTRSSPVCTHSSLCPCTSDPAHSNVVSYAPPLVWFFSWAYHCLPPTLIVWNIEKGHIIFSSICVVVVLKDSQTSLEIHKKHTYLEADGCASIASTWTAHLSVSWRCVLSAFLVSSDCCKYRQLRQRLIFVLQMFLDGLCGSRLIFYITQISGTFPSVSKPCATVMNHHK